MPKIAYISKDFHQSSLDTILRADEIIREYMADGYVLTLRQLYYQFVARDLIPNKQSEYNRLGRLMSDARLAGLIDWNAIEDRTRNLSALAHWDSPADIVRGAASQFRVDHWEGQPYRIEVWIEKEALAGVFSRVCRELDIPFFSCRGYTSQSEMWGAAQRLKEYHLSGQQPLIFHFGDHDPSGIDMTRDIQERMELFGCALRLDRLALNMDQVDEWEPPPNPAKVSDSRFESYLIEFGRQSWELDALEPRVLSDLVRDTVFNYIDQDAWDEADEQIQEGRRALRNISANWDEVEGFLNDE